MIRIDADAHVLETEKTWEYMEGDDRKFRPQSLFPPIVRRMTSIGWSMARFDSNPATSAKTRPWNRASCAIRGRA
jgi:hypothetical protein